MEMKSYISLEGTIILLALFVQKYIFEQRYSKAGAIKCRKEIKITALPNEWRNIPIKFCHRTNSLIFPDLSFLYVFLTPPQSSIGSVLRP